MKHYIFGLLLLSVSFFALPTQAADSPYTTPEEAVLLAIKPRNDVKNTLNKAVPAEVAGLNRAFSSKHIISSREQTLKKYNLPSSGNYTSSKSSCPNGNCVDGAPAARPDISSDAPQAQVTYSTEKYPLVPDTPEAVSNKIIDIYDLNAQPEDFIHLLEPIDENSEEEVTEETTEETAQDEEKTKEQLADGKDEKSAETSSEAPNNNNTQSDTTQIQEEDATVKHLSVRRRFGKPNKDK